MYLPLAAKARRSRPASPVTLLIPAAILVAGLVALPSIAIVSAQPSALVPPSSSSAGTWAFGNVTRTSLDARDLSGSYGANVTYGFVTNVTATNTSATTVEVAVQQTVGISLSLAYCRPSCGSASRQTTDFSYRAWEAQSTWTNLTTAANVTQTFASNGTSLVVNALGVINSSAEVRAFVSESAADTRSTPMNETAVSSLSAEYWFSGNSTIAFAPPLGILPTGSVSAGDSWVSVATFQGSADWAAHWILNLTGMRGGSVTIRDSTSDSIPSTTAPITLLGDAASSGVRLETTRLLSVDYRLGSQFELGPGFAIRWAFPDGLGMGLPSTTTWAERSAVRADATVSALDTLPSPGSPFGLRSSEITFSLAVTDTNNSVNDTVPQSSVSGAPMSPTQAGDTASCLQQASVCSTAIGLGGGSGLSGSGALIVSVVSVVVLAGLVGAVLVTRQRRIPPAQYPNARLYPPGQTVGPADQTAPSAKNGSRPPEGEPDDPLDQLW